MARIKPEKADEKVVISEFGGLRKTSAMTGESAAEIRNFRIAADGSLEKRTGTKTLFELQNAIRGLWQGSLENSDYLVVVAAQYIYLRLPGQTELTTCGLLGTNRGKVSFALYLGTLYLFDGNDCYRFSTADNAFAVAYGYAPLYGTGWHPSNLGEVNEPLNVLAPRIRINYNNSFQYTRINLPFRASAIHRVEVDGTDITDYTFSSGMVYFTIPQSRAHGSLTVWLTLMPSFDRRDTVAGMTNNFLFADARHNSLLLYGGRQSNRIAYSVPVSDEQVAACAYFPDPADALYIPAEHIFTLADTTHPIHAVFRDRDRAILMNDRSAWAIEIPDGQMISYPLEGGMGCSTEGGFALCGGTPVVLQAGGIYQLRFPSGESDLCIPESLSQEVIELLPPSIFQNGILAWFPGRDELWLRDPTEDAEGLVWVYKRQRKEWYCFDNLYISSFFELDGTIGFGTADGKILLSDESSYTDSGAPVTATYCSHYIAFAEPEQVKRALRLTLCADTGGQQLRMSVDIDHRARSYLEAGSSNGKPKLYDFDMCAGRFRFMRYQFQISGSAGARIYRLSVLANR